MLVPGNLMMYNGKRIKVYSIDLFSDFIGVLDLTTGEHIKVDKKELQPILLNQDYLEGLGCKVEEDKILKENIWVSEDGRLVLREGLGNRGEDYWYAHLDSSDMCTIGGADVKYVHELQIFLWLLGYKKEEGLH